MNLNAESSMYGNPSTGGFAANVPVRDDAPTLADNRPEMERLTEQLQRSLMTIDDELRIVSDRVRALGGEWPTVPQGVAGASPRPGNAISCLQELSGTAARLAGAAHDLRERLTELV